MIEKELTALTSWIANVGLEGGGETVLVEGSCGRAVAAGLRSPGRSCSSIRCTRFTAWTRRVSLGAR